MNTSELKEKINHNESLKRFVHRLIISPKRATPRLWVKVFVNPFFSKRARGSIVKWSAKLNVSPINHFSLGRNSIIENYSLVDNGVGSVLIGESSRIGWRNTVIGPVTIGSNVITAQNVVLSGLNHNYENPDVPIRKQGVTASRIVIQNDSWIGANSTITAGVTVSRHSIVAAGSVVVRDVPPFSIVAGVPARIIKHYDFELKEWVSVK